MDGEKWTMEDESGEERGAGMKERRKREQRRRDRRVCEALPASAWSLTSGLLSSLMSQHLSWLTSHNICHAAAAAPVPQLHFLSVLCLCFCSSVPCTWCLSNQGSQKGPQEAGSIRPMLPASWLRRMSTPDISRSAVQVMPSHPIGQQKGQRFRLCRGCVPSPEHFFRWLHSFPAAISLYNAWSSRANLSVSHRLFKRCLVCFYLSWQLCGSIALCW